MFSNLALRSNTSMATSGSLVLLVAVCVLVYGQVARAQPSQVGFLYIACGADTGSVDPATTLVWQPDTDYISTGAVGVANGTSPEYNHFRYFRTDTSVRKNCYSLPVTPSTNYTVRATFFYQNQQVLGNVAPTFQLAVDGTIVANVTTDLDNPITRDITYQSGTGTSTSLCLLSGPQDVGPRFISAIALRPAVMYNRFSRYLDDKKIIRIRARWNFGGTDIIRFPQDYNDRIWFPIGPNLTDYLGKSTAPVQALNTTHKMNMTLYGNFVPENVLQTAVTVQNGNLTVTLPVYSPVSHMLLHFAELDNHTSNVSRKFLVEVPGVEVDSYVNARNYSGEPYKPFFWYFWDLAFTAPSTPITFYSKARSRLGPLINALEFFTIYDVTSSTTLNQDVQAIESLKQDWNLSEWTGDPCVPVPHSWLSCTSTPPTDSSKQPRVQTLDLSGYNLTGAIPDSTIVSLDLTTLLLNNNSFSGTFPNFTALRNLQTLHLQNNQLSGPLPASLVTMPSLRQLNVQNNNLSGTIPAQLLAPPFNLTYRPGNPFLTEPGVSPTSSPTRNTAAKSVGHVSAGVVIFIAILTSLYL